MGLFTDLWTDMTDASDTSSPHSMQFEEKKEKDEKRIYMESIEHVSNASNASPPDLLTRIKEVLATGPIPYSEVLIQTGATEDEIREAIRTWYALVSGPIDGIPHWWIANTASQEATSCPVQAVGQITSHEEAIRLIQDCLTTKELWNLISRFSCDWPKEEFHQVWKALTHQDDVLVDWGDKSMWSHSAEKNIPVFEEVD